MTKSAHLAAFALSVTALSFTAVTALSACGGGGRNDPDPDPSCDVGEARLSSLTFEEVLCLTVAETSGEGSPRFTMKVEPGLSFEVSGFGGDAATPPFILDDSNSSTFANYTREGLSWVAFTGAIGGTPQGDSTLHVDSIDSDTFVGREDGVLVPDAGNDSLDSVFVTIIVGG